MFADPLQITYDGASKDLVKVNQDNWGSSYYLDDGTEKFSISIAHTIPPKGGSGESHLLRLDVDHHDAEGNYLRRASSWAVLKTFDLTQDTTASQDAADALAGLLTTGNVTKLLQREN